MFQKAITRMPSKSIIYGITETNNGAPNYNLAVKQHELYINALQKCNLEVVALEANESFPDWCFVEDVALLTKKCAIITRPGAKSRLHEIDSIEITLKKHFTNIERITESGTIEGGDIMMVGNHYYIGLSKRTNSNGAQQMIKILEKYGFTASTVTLQNVLHLKTGLSYLENNNLLISGEFITKPEFEKLNHLIIPEEAAYSANSLWINNKVIVPKGYSETRKLIEKTGYQTIELDMSEFRKIDGGLSCLSLRF